MIKRFLSVFALTMCVLGVYSQESFVATLEHEGTYTQFYNNTALQKAYEAAVDGDIITLSDGKFDATNIEKNITVRGIGLGLVGQGKKTQISGDFNVYAKDASYTVNMEGLYLLNTLYLHSDGSAATAGTINVIKSRCYSVYLWNSNNTTVESTVKMNFFNCWVNGEIHADKTYTNLKFYNSYISSNYMYTVESNVANTQFFNCFISSDPSDSNYAMFSNCIFKYGGNFYRPLPSTAYCTHCISYLLNSDYDIFNSLTIKDDCTYLGRIEDSVVFSDIDNFILQDSIATKYLGTDGKQVGMYGGIGYTTKLRYPVISELNIGNGRTTSKAGILDVNIKLDGEE